MDSTFEQPTQTQVEVQAGSIIVGGVEVTQDLLEQMHDCLLGCDASPYRKLVSVADGNKPHIDTLAKCGGGEVDSAEDFIFALLTDPSIAPRDFRTRFLGRAEQVKPYQPIAMLKRAGFPVRVALAAPDQTTRSQIEGWAEGFKTYKYTWVWVIDGDDMARCLQLARIAVLAARKMARSGIDPMGAIVYRTIPDLVDEINSCDLYGRDSKRNAIVGYRQATLLLLDGVGDEQAGNKPLDALSKIVGSRWMDGLPTVFAGKCGLQAWMGTYARYDHATTQKMVTQIVGAMCGYREGLTREETEQATRSSVIRLDWLGNGPAT